MLINMYELLTLLHIFIPLARSKICTKHYEGPVKDLTNFEFHFHSPGIVCGLRLSS